MKWQNTYVSKSLQCNLFFMRIMKEHLYFIRNATNKKEKFLINKNLQLSERAREIFCRTIYLSNGHIHKNTIKYGEFITPYTLKCEIKSMKYNRDLIDINLTKAQYMILKKNYVEEYIPLKCEDDIEHEVERLNCEVLKFLKEVIYFKEFIYKKFIDCKIFFNIYPSLLHHVKMEAEFYRKLVLNLEHNKHCKESMLKKEKLLFWNHIMEEHGGFISGLLDRNERKLINKSEEFAKKYHRLEYKMKHEKNCLEKNIRDSLKLTKDFRGFKQEATERILCCKIRGIIDPLLSDHVLREANHFIRILEEIK